MIELSWLQTQEDANQRNTVDLVLVQKSKNLIDEPVDNFITQLLLFLSYKLKLLNKKYVIDLVLEIKLSYNFSSYFYFFNNIIFFSLRFVFVVKYFFNLASDVFIE